MKYELFYKTLRTFHNLEIDYNSDELIHKPTLGKRIKVMGHILMLYKEKELDDKYLWYVTEPITGLGVTLCGHETWRAAIYEVKQRLKYHKNDLLYQIVKHVEKHGRTPWREHEAVFREEEFSE